MSTKIKIKVVNKPNADYMGMTTGSEEKNGKHYSKATIRINEAAIEGEGSRFGSVEEGINTVGIHEKIHLEPDQIAIDKQRRADESMEDYYENEEATMNAEYDSREVYRNEKGLENEEWKKPYESTTDSQGNKKPSYQGTKKKEDENSGS